MVSVIYASIAAVWILWLVLQVVKARRRNQIKYGDGGVAELQAARSAHSNATETIPIALILLFGLEINDGSLWLVHLLGALLIIARMIHGAGILSDKLKYRALGMKLTLATILALVAANLIYLPYETLI